MQLLQRKVKLNVLVVVDLIPQIIDSLQLVVNKESLLLVHKL